MSIDSPELYEFKKIYIAKILKDIGELWTYINVLI